MAAAAKRSARDYEQALRRQELAAGRALVQAVGDQASPGPRELAAARRVLTQALFELRRLAHDLDQEIESLSKAKGPRPARAAQGSNPGELDRFEAVRNAVEEVAERWEGRRDQLSAELDRRQPRHAKGRRSGQAPPRQGGQPRGARGRGEGRGRGEVRGRREARDGAPARPERPRSPRSRRSPG